ncbi:MAG: MATE family efflux transporter [Clostridium sp.]|nr:MATE family efflux transporter [Clostridium sp.]
MNQTFMKEKKILPLVLSMALPMVLSMAVNSLYNIIDSYFVARVNENAITALSLVFPIQNLILAVAVGFGIGINAMVAYYLGAGQKNDANTTASIGVLLSIIHGILLTIVCMLGIPAFLKMFHPDAQVLELALDYSYRAFLFTIIIQLYITFEKLYQSVGKMKISMICMIAGFIVNIILDPLMIFGIGFFPKMGIAGAAWATGIGQLVTLIAYVIFYYCHGKPAEITIKNIRWNKAILKRVYGIGIPATFNMALPSFLISSLNGILSTFSEVYVLVLGAYYKLQTFIYLSANGMIQGIRPIISYNYGAGEYKRVQKIYHVSLRLAAGIMLIGTVLSWVIPEQLIGLFTKNPSTVELGVKALHIISLSFIISAVSVTTSGALEALGKGFDSLIISLIRNAVVILPMALVLSKLIGVEGVWYAFVTTEVVACIVSIIMYYRNIHLLEKS